MKSTIILSVVFVYLLSSLPGMVWGRSKPISYRTGTNASEPYLHKDIQLLSHYIRMHLVSLDEIKYEIQYELRVEKEFVENPFLYASAREEEKFIQVNGNNLITVPYDRESLKEEDWKEIEKIYRKDFFNYPVKYVLTYLPVTLEQGDHRITVRYKAQTNARFDSPSNIYIYIYCFLFLRTDKRYSSCIR